LNKFGIVANSTTKSLLVLEVKRYMLVYKNGDLGCIDGVSEYIVHPYSSDAIISFQMLSKASGLMLSCGMSKIVLRGIVSPAMVAQKCKVRVRGGEGMPRTFNLWVMRVAYYFGGTGGNNGGGEVGYNGIQIGTGKACE
jgi:hypothetical protein